jgi:hypothetical protein
MIGLIERSLKLAWGIISQTCGKQEVGIHEDSWLSFVDVIIITIMLVKAHGSWAMNGYYVVKSCISLNLCEGVEP